MFKVHEKKEVNQVNMEGYLANDLVTNVNKN